jgi:hypothetical protein
VPLGELPTRGPELVDIPEDGLDLERPILFLIALSAFT